MTPDDSADVPVEVAHQNTVHLIGRVSTPPARRTLPSGDEVVALGLAVRRPGGGVDAIPVQVGPAPARGGRARRGQIGRRVLADVARLRTGDVVDVRGHLQRRWWHAGGARRSRVEVSAAAIARVED